MPPALRTICRPLVAENASGRALFETAPYGRPSLHRRQSSRQAARARQRLSNETIDGNAKTDKLLSRALMEFFRDSWLAGTGVAFDDPRVNLLRADLRGVPPICVYYGGHELLAGESVEFADRARQAGVDVTLHALPEGQHSFILAAGRVPEVVEAVEEMGVWLRDKLRVGAGLSSSRRSRVRSGAAAQSGGGACRS